MRSDKTERLGFDPLAPVHLAFPDSRLPCCAPRAQESMEPAVPIEDSGLAPALNDLFLLSAEDDSISPPPARESLPGFPDQSDVWIGN
jgi:hypothetical protein